MRILFAALHNGYFRNLESVVDELARRGHEIHLGAERHESALGGQCIVERLARAHPGITHGRTSRRERRWFFLASKIRLSLDYLRYLEPPYEQTPALRQRAQVRTPIGLVRLARSPLLASPSARRRAARGLDALDHALPPSQAIERFLDERRPDIIIVTPLIGVVASSQLDLLRSAQARGIPTAVCVWSWDHLSSKAIIRDFPDALFVWNDIQKQEAIEMHGVPDRQIVVTGAQCFDRWFNRAPSRSRSEFVRRIGLPDERPYVLWVCSALFQGSPSEAEFVMRWIAHLRSSADPGVREARIVIRPHPSRVEEWDSIDWRRPGGVTLWGGNPIDEGSRADYFDSIYYSAAVAGLNTSAFIEAGIVGRPVMAILPEEFRSNQEGTLHFRYLTTVGGGLLTVARSLDEHERQMGAILGGAEPALLERQRGFIRAFVRPHGLDVPATAIMADAIERLAATTPGEPPRRASIAGKIGLRALDAIERLPRARRLLLNERETRAKRRRAEEEGGAARVS